MSVVVENGQLLVPRSTSGIKERTVLVELDGYRPQVSPSAFVAPTAVLVGNVIVEDEASIWYGAVLRADHGAQAIIVGARTSVQDNCVIHVALDHGTTLGTDVTIGHGAILEGCDVEDGAVVGMNAVVLDHARVGAGSLLAAGSSVLARATIPPNVLAAGTPAGVKKEITGGARWWIENSGKYYVDLAKRYKAQGLDR
jgi:carbonic anhydrase/acetyltransferase-like protein (isoleucine patch superfamily)